MKMLSIRDVSQRRNEGLRLIEGSRINIEKTLRVYVLSTFNTDFLPPFLMESFSRRNIKAKVDVGGFDQWAQEILDNSSGLYQLEPDLVLILPSVEDLLKHLYDDPFSINSQQLAQERIDDLKFGVTLLLDRLPNAVCCIATIGCMFPPMAQILSPNSETRGQAIIDMTLDAVRSLEKISPRILIADWDWRVRALGYGNFVDERLWYLARMRLNMMGIADLADTIVDYWKVYNGITAKVLVVDLDDTLWGGIVGEVGVGGITLSNESVGLAFQAFQKELLKLYSIGVVLAVVSKNNYQDAIEVFEKHPDMILKASHFAAVRINWQDKATNIQEISEELNLGLDSFVFLDDNPVEREWVRSSLPDVYVPDLPIDPSDRPLFVRTLPHFRRITLTETDWKRAESYKTQGLRRELRDRATTAEEFLSALQQVVHIARVNNTTLARAAQLSQRTNQFNLTTKRYNIADIERMLLDPEYMMYTISVKDRFGDNGITGLVILRVSPDMADIDTFLLSCRVLGRQVEQVMLTHLVNVCKCQGITRLRGVYFPTDKNKQVRDLYPHLGFAEIGNNVYILNISNLETSMPSYIKVEYSDA